MNRVRRVEHGISFKCPGCGDTHYVPTEGDHAWEWNGDLERPTIKPSVLVRSGHHAPHYKPGDECWCGKDYGFICHSGITNGTIFFAPDSTHALSGQTVDLPDIAD